MPVGFIDGFDRYPNVSGGVGVRGMWTGTGGGSLVTGRVGGQGYQCNSSTGTHAIQKPLQASTQYSGFTAFYHSNYTGSVTTNNMSLKNATGIEVFGIAYNADDAMIVSLRGVVVATIPLTLGPAVWHGISWVYENHLTLGKLQVRVNGELLVNIANVNTTFQSGVNQVTEYEIKGKPTSGVGGAAIFDDIRVDYDTLVPIPEGRVAPKFPNSDIVANWTRLSGASNYLMVDEVICDSDVTYNSSTVKNTKDEYGFSALGFNPDKIHAIQVAVAARKDDASTRVIGTKLKSGAAAVVMPLNYLGTDYQWHEKVFVPAEFGETEFTLAMLNAMTVEIEDLGDGT